MNLVAGIGFSGLIVLEILTLLFLFIYLIFAAVVIKQVKIMTETLEVGFERPVKVLAFVHFAFAVFVLFSAVIVFI